MNRKQLFEQIQAKKSMLCVGLDVDYNKMPEHVKALANKGEIAIKGDLFKGTARSIVEFNKAIVDATAAHCVAYKPNLAFYECYGIDGMRALDATVDYIRTHYPEIFLIADAKRGDIGNTAKMYAKAFFEEMDFDAVTIAPYMGADSVTPFLEYKDKWAIVLALTSNASAYQFQNAVKDGKPLYQAVRAAHPNLPIIFISAPTVIKEPENFDQRRAAVRATYDAAVAEGDTNVYYIDGAELLAGECWDSCTVDGVHPNDFGFYRMAMRIEKTLKPIIDAMEK